MFYFFFLHLSKLNNANTGPAFASFVPRLLHLQIASQVVQRPDEPDPTFEGAGACITSAVLFADASGFTALTEKLAKAAGKIWFTY